MVLLNICKQLMFVMDIMLKALVEALSELDHRLKADCFKTTLIHFSYLHRRAIYKEAYYQSQFN